MAAPDETIDPNDLDSIDALLDEAELEVPKEQEVTSDSEQDAIDTLLNEAELAETPVQKEQSPQSNEPENTQEILQNDTPEAVPDLEKNQPKMQKTVTEEAIPQPVIKQSTLNTEMTAKDMDAIKKLIIIFGATLIVLMLIGIGIGIWSALAAQGSALDEETQTLIESVQVNTERVATNVMDSNETVKAIEKKLDALNFQLEQLATDLLEGSFPASTQAPSQLDPLGLNTHEDIQEKKTVHPVKTVPVTTNQAIQPDSETHKLTASMNKKIISTQRRIDEVNRRVKDIQAKHKTVLLSIKSLEKQMILQQKRMVFKAKESQKKQESNPYQYSAPDGSYYDQSVGDTYP
ncbi:Fibronectin-binding protein [hydrothermal vent metagenome]|uniref:Fibronectin-binding protein n=1 Tax=hydrothermal vent metagenome TaxID=652676 RepID=A0A3B0W2Y2_9ZZZZ